MLSIANTHKATAAVTIRPLERGPIPTHPKHHKNLTPKNAVKVHCFIAVRADLAPKRRECEKKSSEKVWKSESLERWKNTGANSGQARKRKEKQRRKNYKYSQDSPVSGFSICPKSLLVRSNSKHAQDFHTCTGRGIASFLLTETRHLPLLYQPVLRLGFKNNTWIKHETRRN